MNEIFDTRLLGDGLTEAEAELGLCDVVASVPDVWSRLYAFGIRGNAVTGGSHFAALHVAAVVFLDDCRFELGHNLRDATGAVIAIIIPAPDIDGRAQNLVACDLEFRRVAIWRATVPILGMNRLNHPRIEPLQVFRDVLGWLRANREGIVILNYPGAARHLCEGQTLAVGDVSFGRELSAKLRIGPPRIVARENGQRAA